MVEQVKRKKEILQSKIESKTAELNDKVNQICQSKSFSCLSLYLSIYSIVALLVAGFSPRHSIFCQSVWTVYTILSLGLVVVGWFHGEQERQWKRLDFSKLRHALSYFGMFVFLSLLAGFLLVRFVSVKDIISRGWPYVVVFSAILPFLNFVVFFCKIRWKVQKVEKSIEQSVTELEPDTEEIEELANQLLTSVKLGAVLSTQEKDC